MPTTKFQGSCFCGTVKFEIAPPYSAFRYCHCSRCRKASGSAHAANLFVPKTQFAWLAGESAVKRYKVPGAERFAVWFCPDCGTRVPHEIPARGEFLIPAGILDADPGARPDNSIFWNSRAPWYVEPHEHAQFPEYPK